MKKDSKACFSKKCVKFMFASVYVFTALMIVCYLKTGGVPDELIIAFFAWHGVEGGAMAWIRTCKAKKDGGKKDERTVIEDIN